MVSENAILTNLKQEVFSLKRSFVLLSLCLALSILMPAAALNLTTLETENAAPIAENLTLTTYKNVAICGQCAAVDPEGDLVTFRLVDKPARGAVELQEDGAFCYSPYDNKKGKDTFTYVAVDAAGNVSDEATVKITIEKQATSLSYSDMEENPAHYAALRLAENEIFVGANVGGIYCFQPNATVSRSEFLTMAMTVAGMDALEGVTVTGFHDDENIPTWAKGYVSAAVMSGAVQGRYGSSGQVLFHSEDSITAAEAAVLVDRLLAMDDVSSQSAFAEESVPVWAYQSVVNMEAVDVVSSTLSLSEPLTRAVAAEMLCAMMDVVDSRSESGWLW